MSDAGGEYKLDVFLKVLKDEGITVCWSALHIYTSAEWAC